MIDSQEMHKLMELQKMLGIDNFRVRSIAEELKLSEMIELLSNAPGIGWSPSARRMIAEHLVVNGVEIPVRCKDCKSHKEGYCYRKVVGLYAPTIVPPNHYCSYGKRKDNNA